MLCLQQGKDEEAFGYLYADAVTGSVKSKALQMRWTGALKRPVSAIRFGVAVTYNKPEKYTGSVLAIGTKFNEQGQPQGAGGGPGMMMAPPPGVPGGAGGGNQAADSGPADPVANFEHYTGEFGKKLMSGLNERLRRGDYGAFYKDAVDYKAPPRPAPLNLASFMGGPPPSSPTPGGGYGTGPVGPPGGGYGAPGGGSPNPGPGGFPPGSGPPPPPSSTTSPGGGGLGSNFRTRPLTIDIGKNQVLAQQQDGAAAVGGPPTFGAGGPQGPGAPGMMGPGGMLGGQAAAPKPVSGVKYYKYTSGESQKEIIDKAKRDGIDVLIHFSVKVEPPNRLGRGADNTTTCRLVNVHDGSPLYEGGRSLTASKVSEKPELVEAAVKAIFDMMENGVATGKPVGKLALDELPSAVNSETVKGRVQKLSTPGGEGTELMQRLAELRFYNAKRILSLIEMKASYEAILGADAGAKLALGSSSDKKLAVVKWTPNVEPRLAPPPAANNTVGGYGAGGIGAPPGGIGGPPAGYGGPPGGIGGPPGGVGSSPPSGYGPPGGVGGSPSPGAPGSSDFGAPPPGVGGPPGGGGLPGSKGSGS